MNNDEILFSENNAYRVIENGDETLFQTAVCWFSFGKLNDGVT